MLELSDEELVARYLAEAESRRDNAFISELFGRHHSRVATWCYRMTGDRESAADLAQDIFLKAFEHLRSFRGESKFTTWLYTIARNHCANEMRSRASRAADLGETALFDAPDLSEAADVAIARQHSKQMLRDLMLEVLDDTELQVMTLHYAEELSLDVITRMLSLTNASGAKAFIVSAKRKLNSAVARWSGLGNRAAAGERRRD